jgi:serine/threonine protein kinase
MADASGAPVKPGDTIEGRYRVIRALDAGGMGSVFLAEHVLIKRRVAVKLLRAELAEDADVLERFMNEARAAGTLGHPNIVESTDMGFTRDGLPYIVFEYLEGSLLTDEIYRVRGMPIRRALRIGRQIASALAAAHAAGVVHRDLKADNIFLTDREEASDHVKVLDFGIASFIEAEGGSVKNREMVIGTPQFMAPEQITAPETVDQRADIYALGVILYEMLAARRPFDNDEDPEAVFRQVVSDPVPALGVPDLPPGFEEMLLDKFLAKRADDRYQTMKDVEGALNAFAGAVRPVGRDSEPIPLASPAEAWPPQPPSSMPTVATVISLPTPPVRSNRALLLLAITVIAAGVSMMFITSDKPTRDLTRVRADAEKLASAIEAATKGAQLRAGGFAQSPQLRAAVETDAATVKDMVKGDFMVTPAAGEIFELFQLHDQTIVPMLLIPDGAPLPARADNQPRLHTDGKTLAVVVSAPVLTQRSTVGGGVALSVPIDLAPIAQQLATHTSGASLQGLDHPVPLGAIPPATSTEIPVTVMKELGADLKLVAAVPEIKDETPHRLALARVGCWIVGGFLALLYLVNLIRMRRRG